MTDQPNTENLDPVLTEFFKQLDKAEDKLAVVDRFAAKYPERAREFLQYYQTQQSLDAGFVRRIAPVPKQLGDFSTINIGTGHRCVDVVDRWNGQTWRDHLSRIRRCWRGWNIVLFLDRGSPHTAKASRSLASELGVELRWLPTACPELNPVEDIWRWLKGTILSNYQPDDFNDTVARATEAIEELTPHNLLTKAGVLSQNFWLST